MENIDLSPSSGSCGGGCSSPSTGPTPTSTTTAPQALEFHICAGLNACRGHDRYGTNTCAGTGYCATAQAHTCHTLNNCRGQGGCGLYGDGAEQSKPGANDCCWQGSCAVPVQAERWSTQGENTGKSVWVLARKLFEDRMKEANRSFGAPPFKCGPPQAWLTEIMGGVYDSCGNSGNKYCSFGFNDPAADAAELCKRSEPSGCGAPGHCGGPVHCSDVKAYSESNGCDDPSGPAGCSAAPDDPEGPEDPSGPAGCSAKPGGGGGFHDADVKAYSESNGCDDPSGPAGCSAAPDDPEGPEDPSGPAGCSAKPGGGGGFHTADVTAYSESNGCDDPSGPAGCSAAPDDPEGPEDPSGPAGCSAKRDSN
jgi:hypothetical protein